ncbi:uncharacterized protein LOC134565396 isoform X3 [Prinia subflava]|uniref:uncharacterized protein LOC134565396 isoform X3 n=1 Tax=Prinia subflava TaxID=208062 RepID=UPI002FE3E026
MAARGGLCPRKALSPPCPEGKPFPPFAASPWPKSPVRGRARAGPEARNAERDGPRSPLSARERGVAQCPWAPSRQDRAAASSPREAEPDPQLLQWEDGSSFNSSVPVLGDAECVFLAENKLRSIFCSNPMPYLCSRPQTPL